MTVRCSQGHEKPDGSAFCDECGEPLVASAGSAGPTVMVPPPSPAGGQAPSAASASGTVICPQCGTQNSASELFCSNCGTNLKMSATGPAPQPAYQPPISQPQAPAYQPPISQPQAPTYQPQAPAYQPPISQ